jgi:hypothetical protein
MILDVSVAGVVPQSLQLQAQVTLASPPNSGSVFFYIVTIFHCCHLYVFYTHLYE